MRITAFRRLVSGVVLPLVVGAIVLGPTTEAHAWDGVRIHGYTFENVANNTGDANVNGARFSITAANGCPDLLNASNNQSWTFSPLPPECNGVFREMLLGGALLSGTGTFNGRVRILGAAPFYSIATFKYRVGTTALSPLTVLGWQVGSPPTLVNPTNLPAPDGVNTTNMKVRNLQFAEACCGRVGNLTIANTTALFAASLDPVRPGPIGGVNGIAPGGSFTINDLHASISDPSPEGLTVIAKGTVEDSNGNQIPFLTQFEIPPGGPGTSPLTLILLALAMVTLGALYVWRSRALTRTAA